MARQFKLEISSMIKIKRINSISMAFARTGSRSSRNIAFKVATMRDFYFNFSFSVMSTVNSLDLEEEEITTYVNTSTSINIIILKYSSNSNSSSHIISRLVLTKCRQGNLVVVEYII